MRPRRARRTRRPGRSTRPPPGSASAKRRRGSDESDDDESWTNGQPRSKRHRKSKKKSASTHSTDAETSAEHRKALGQARRNLSKPVPGTTKYIDWEGNERESTAKKGYNESGQSIAKVNAMKTGTVARAQRGKRTSHKKNKGHLHLIPRLAALAADPVSCAPLLQTALVSSSSLN